MSDQEKTMTLEDLKCFIQKEVIEPNNKEVTAQFDVLKKEIADQNIKRIVPQMEGDFKDGFGHTAFGTTFDTSCMSRIKSNSGLATEQEYGTSFCTQGGFFRKLSPGMEMFAQFLATKGKDYNREAIAAECMKQFKVLGMKAATGMGEANVGFQIPIEFPSIIIEAAVADSPVLSKVWRFPMNENSVSIPKLSQSDDSYFGGVLTTWSGVATSGEGSLMTATDPTTDKNVFTAKKITQMVVLTDELISDSPINILNWITGLLIRKFKYDLERVIIRGNGSTEPTGIISDAGVISTAVTRTTTSYAKYEDFVKLDGAVNEIFDNTTFLTRRATLANVRGQKDSSERPIWFDSYGGAMGQNTRGPSILGSPYHLTRNVPVMGQRGDVIVGDLGMYMLGMRADMRIDISDAPGFKNNETYVRFIARCDGKPGTSFAFKMLEGKLS